MSKSWHEMNKDDHIIRLQEIITQFPDKNWDWDKLSKDPNIATLEFISKHPDLSWDWDMFSENPNITVKFVSMHINKNWDWHALSKNPNVATHEFMIATPDKDWDHAFVSTEYYKNASLKYISEHVHFPWNWTDLSKHRFHDLYVLI